MPKELTILVAEDDPNDADLLKIAMERAGVTNPVHFVKDGQEAVDYLRGCGKYGDRDKFPFPQVVISDLKMPRLSGLELLDWLHRHPECKVIPTVLLSGSGLAADVEKAYRFGANSYFRKPAGIQQLTELMRVLHRYWCTSEIPYLVHNC
jgi:CheY-like chemotaxis protein